MSLVNLAPVASTPNYGGYATGDFFQRFNTPVVAAFDGVRHTVAGTDESAGYWQSNNNTSVVREGCLSRYFNRPRRISKIVVIHIRASFTSDVTTISDVETSYLAQAEYFLEGRDEAGDWNEIEHVTGNTLVKNTFDGLDLTYNAYRFRVPLGVTGGFFGNAALGELELWGDDGDALNAQDGDTDGNVPYITGYGDSTLTIAFTVEPKFNVLMQAVYPDLALDNKALTGSSIPEIGGNGFNGAWLFHDDVMAGDHKLFWFGHNDFRIYDGSDTDQMLDWMEALTSDLVWLSIRNERKHKCVDATLSGTWAEDDSELFGGVHGPGCQTSELNATATFTAHGTKLAVGLYAYKAGKGDPYDGVAEIFIDGVSQGTVNTLYRTDMTTLNSLQYGPKGFIFTGLSDEDHEVVVKNVSSGKNIYVQYVAELDNASDRSNTVSVANKMPSTKYEFGGAFASDANTTAINAHLATKVAELQGYGLPIRGVLDVHSLIQLEDLYTDGLHENEETGTAKLAAFFWEEMEQVLPPLPFAAGFSFGGLTDGNLEASDTLIIIDSSSGSGRTYEYKLNGVTVSTDAAPNLTTLLENGENTIQQIVTKDSDSDSVTHTVNVVPKIVDVTPDSPTVEFDVTVPAGIAFKMRVRSINGAGTPGGWVGYVEETAT